MTPPVGAGLVVRTSPARLTPEEVYQDGQGSDVRNVTLTNTCAKERRPNKALLGVPLTFLLSTAASSHRQQLDRMFSTAAPPRRSTVTRAWIASIPMPVTSRYAEKARRCRDSSSGQSLR